MLRAFHYIAVFVLLLCGFNHASLASDQQEDTIQQTLLPFDYSQFTIDEMLDPPMGIQYYEGDRYAKYELSKNALLFNAIQQKKYLNDQYYPHWYMKLKHDKPFDSYLVGGNGNTYLINVDSDYHIISEMRLDELSYQKGLVNHWRSFYIDEQLALTVRDELAIFRESMNMVERLKKISWHSYQITDNGSIIGLSNKVYPSHQADYEPINPDNCIAAVVRSSPYLLNKDVSTSAVLPLSGKGYEGKIHQLIQATGKTYPTECYAAVAHDYLLLPDVNQHAVILFEGYDFQRHQKNETLYLVTVNQERKIKDVMVIYYQRNNGKQKINFTINADHRIELQMTEPDGKTLTQSYQINQQGEFE